MATDEATLLTTWDSFTSTITGPITRFIPLNLDLPKIQLSIAVSMPMILLSAQ
jgi:hypothetical protein